MGFSIIFVKFDGLLCGLAGLGERRLGGFPGSLVVPQQRQCPGLAGVGAGIFRINDCSGLEQDGRILQRVITPVCQPLTGPQVQIVGGGVGGAGFTGLRRESRRCNPSAETPDALH